MRPNSPSAILSSLILHGFVAALIFLTTMYVARSERLQPVIFELVAGPPTAPDELIAPAKGNSVTALVVPKLPEVKPTPAPEPEPVVAPPPKPTPAVTKPVQKPATLSYKEFIKNQPKAKPQAANPPRRTANVPRIDVKGIAEGVKGGSTDNTRGGGGGNALTREEHSELDTYISFLLQELKKAHEPPPGVSDQLATRVTFDITASGAILNPRISKSSGNREFDESVLEAFRRMRSIGPTPTRRPYTWTVTFKMREE